MDNKPADPKIGSASRKKATSSGKAATGKAAAGKAPEGRAPEVRAMAGTTPVSSQYAAPAQSAPSSAAQTAKAKAASMADTAASTARQTASSFTERVETRAESAVDSVISQVHDRVGAGKQQASGYVSSVGRALHAAGRSLEDDGLNFPASYVRAAANGLEQAANEVDGFDTGSLTANVERQVRGNPMLAVAGMALVGFALTRFIGSSRRR